MRSLLYICLLVIAGWLDPGLPLLFAQQPNSDQGAGLQQEAASAQDAAQIPWDKWIDLGVATVIPPGLDDQDTYSGPRPLVELIKNNPDLQWTMNFWPESETLHWKARSAVLRRQIWGLEFAFKPVRMIEVDVPLPDGRMERKRVWYMIYRVRYPGGDLNPTPKQDQWGQTLFENEPANYEHRRFMPLFVLESHEFNKSYLDRIIPTAQEAIERRETPGNKLYNSVEITKVPIPLSSDRIDRGVTGVVMWEDVDPRIDFFSVYVQGLTNAYKYEDPEGAYQAGDPPGTGRTYQTKTLQLNFWRPGDDLMEHEREVRYGVPADPDPTMQQQILERFGLSKRLDHQWVYR